MSLEINIRNLATRIATEFKALRVVTGSLANLTTTQKGNLVAALNELQAAIASATNINDAAAGPSTTYSSQKIEAQIQGAISALVGGAPTALDTLKELADALADDDSQINALILALDNRVRFDAAQTLSAAQQGVARSNIGAQDAQAIGDTERDFAADFAAAL